MIDPHIYKIFKNGSTTYFYSSLFFPEDIKKDVFTFYSFVRKADDFVDQIPQDKVSFYLFLNEYKACLREQNINDIVIKNFVALMKYKKIDVSLVDAFLDAMESDLFKKKYLTLDETKKYMYGSAEVIGIIMCKIMNLPSISYPYGAKLGRAMQYINFIRDIQEDNMLGRIYLPISELRKYNLSDTYYVESNTWKENFTNFVRSQITIYKKWQREAENGFKYIPYRYRVPIQTASDMYKWTADTIYNNPLVVYDHKVKPNKKKIITQAFINSIKCKV